jgi:hypothetical protein
MIDYCKKNNLPAAQEWAWKEVNNNWIKENL